MFKFFVEMTTVTFVLDDVDASPASTVSPIAVIEYCTWLLLLVVSSAVGWSSTKLRTAVASFAVLVVICVDVESTLVVRSRAATATAAFASVVARESSVLSDDGDEEGDGAGVLGGRTATTEIVEAKISETVSGGSVESAELVVDVACGSVRRRAGWCGARAMRGARSVATGGDGSFLFASAHRCVQLIQVGCALSRGDGGILSLQICAGGRGRKRVCDQLRSTGGWGRGRRRWQGRS